MIRPTPESISPELREIKEAFMFGAAIQCGAGPTFQNIADAHPEVVAHLAKLDPARSAAVVGSLLTLPELQANCLRIETLVHLALMVGRGRDKVSDPHVRTMFRALGNGFCGRMEDPAEDIFVGTVRTSRGNFRILEGIWEGNAFYLQHLLNVMEAMPAGSGYNQLRDDVYALLTLSDLICERARLQPHQLGAELPLERLSAKDHGPLAVKAARIRFTTTELEQGGINPLLLAPFLFMLSDRALLGTECLGNSSLERRPLIRVGDHIVVVLPTAISAAIRCHLIERMKVLGMLGAFRRGIANEYAQHFSGLQLLGRRGRAPIAFQFLKHGAFAGVVSTVDQGRYLNAIFFTDQFTDFEKTGLAGMNPESPLMGDIIKKHIDHAYNQACKRPDFVDGISLLVGCGVGRGAAIASDLEAHPNWRVEFISAYDFDTLSWMPGFTPLFLWRLLTARDQVNALGAGLQNINGLLNLVAWTRSLDGHLVPHGDLPDDFVREGRGAFLMINQNSLRDLRHEVALHHDVRVVQDWQGRWVPVRRDRQSEFADDDAAPLYGSEIVNDEGRLMSVYLAPVRSWWAEASMPEETPGEVAYERWRLMTVWLSRAVPMLDRLSSLPAGTIKWRAVFEAPSGGLRAQAPLHNYEEVRAAISVTIDFATATIITTAPTIFEDALCHVENIAERALVDAMLEGVLTLSGAAQDDRPLLLRLIVPSPQVRHAHGFAARGFRDLVRHKLGGHVIKIDRYDDAANRLGLGWTVRDRSLGSRLSGKVATIAYLNTLVTAIEDSLCADLRAFNREALLRRLLLNHEAAAVDRDRWRRTSASVLALHPDTESTLAVIGKHDMELSATFQTSRILMEVAICESPLTGGREPGDLDLSRLMAKAGLIFHLGGWSDAIRWDVMEPLVRITPLGDVHAKLDYIDNVVMPHVQEMNYVRTRHAADKYADNLKQVEGRKSVSELMDSKFLEAWSEEFGASFEETRILIDWLENKGLERDEPVISLSLADFETVNAEGQTLATNVVTRLLNVFTLFSRTSWREVPDGFDDRDRQPWRYRRRLSAMRRPVLKIGSGDAELYLVAPGMMRESFAYQVSNYMSGDFPPYQLGRKMKAWAGREANARGAKFTREVAAALEELGWKTDIEVKLTKILRQSLDRDYGDVDVLAWQPGEKRILIVECKDVQFKKTYGEMSEQLGDFRGELRSNGKPDYLRRHLDRMDVLREHTAVVASYCKLGSAEVHLQSHLIFKNPVPMKYALKKMSERVVVSLYDEISDWA
jgi:hypothetical protein